MRIWKQKTFPKCKRCGAIMRKIYDFGVPAKKAYWCSNCKRIVLEEKR